MLPSNQKFHLIKFFLVTSGVAFLVFLSVVSFTYRTNQIDKMIATIEYQNQ